MDEMVTKVSAAVAVLDSDGEDKPSSPVLTVPGFEITRREDAILRLLDAGASDGQIPARLGIPAASISWHIEQLMVKLGTDTPETALTRWQSLTSNARAVTT